MKDPLLPTIQWSGEGDAASVFTQMARDEILFSEAAAPWFRLYRWDHPAATIGCSTKVEGVAGELGDRPWTRRLTGGGVVLHDSDWTYTLVVPRHCLPEGMRPQAWYALLHGLLADYSADDGMHLAGCDGPGPADWCFRRAVTHDLLDAEGAKRGGAALRLTRAGLLMQGSLRVDAAIDWPALLQALARQVQPASWPAAWEMSVSRLARDRYESDAWKLDRRWIPPQSAPTT